MNGDQPEPALREPQNQENHSMKDKYLKLGIAACLVIASAAILAACNQTTSRGPSTPFDKSSGAQGYASAAGPSANLFPPSGYQTINDPRGYTCGPDSKVCHYELRDRLVRGQQ